MQKQINIWGTKWLFAILSHRFSIIKPTSSKPTIIKASMLKVKTCVSKMKMEEDNVFVYNFCLLNLRSEVTMKEEC